MDRAIADSQLLQSSAAPTRRASRIRSTIR
jgi:hypothetical protein